MKTKIEIEIEFTSGSQYQKEFGVNAMQLALKAIVQYLSTSHKKNKLDIKKFDIKDL